ncbi:MAG: response regulator [bacterium]|nr:response regulator [bacterium]
MIKLLIVDDEPLVQIGIKSMLHWQDLGIEVCGTAMNGEVAFHMIEELSPDIVITDIKMPILNGLDLVKKSRDSFGSIPLFIVLTSYEEFSLIRQAISYQAIDYLVKLELDAAGLESAIRRALERLEELRASEAYRQAGGNTLLQSYDYKDKFFMRLLHNLFDNPEQFYIQSKDLKLDFSDCCYLAVHGEIHSDTASSMDAARQSNLYSSSLQMIQEILNKHLPCYVLSLDKIHFAVIFHAAELSSLNLAAIQKALDNACTMVHNYFNVWLTLGIGNPVDEALKISVSYQEAWQAFNLSKRETPITPFSSVSKDSFRNAFNILYLALSLLPMGKKACRKFSRLTQMATAPSTRWNLCWKSPTGSTRSETDCANCLRAKEKPTKTM